VKRYLRPGDAYLHADVFGAASCILRAKRRRVVTRGKNNSDKTGGSSSTEPIPLSEQSLREAGNFTICHSSAWSSRMVTSAWWVESHQVSKTAPSGEYLTVGSFMIRGKKNFLPPSQLELGLAVLFRLGDNEGILRHANERRDFALSELEEEGLDDADDMVVDQTSKKIADTKKLAAGKHKDKNQSLLTIESVEESPDEPEKTTTSSKEGLIEASAEEQVDSRAQDEELAKEENGHATAQNVSSNENDASLETMGAMNENVESKPGNKKRGYSVRERKLIKKYGSLEEAEKALGDASKEATPPVSKPSINPSAQAATDAGNMKRGKKSKMKRAMKKYVDQDEDDRELALLLLQGGETSKNDKNESKTEDASQAQQLAAAETAAVLVKDSSEVAKRLSDDVRSLLAQCVQVGNSNKGAIVEEEPHQQQQTPEMIRWAKLDADILEQLIALEPHEAQVAAATRLLTLRNSTRVDNFSSSLAGILRTIGKYGYESLNKKNESGEMPDKAKRKGEAEKEAESSEWKDVLAEEGIPEGDLDDDAVDDTLDLKKLTGKPLPEDLLLYAVPVLAPYQTVSQYRYRVKLTPGSMKRGKAAKQCLEMLTKGDKSPGASEQFKGLIKKVIDNDWVQTIISDVKISAQGASKLNKNQKGKSGGKKK
jgi:NFACT protein C-terminal domain/NFACT protein RNA binding domain